MLKSGATAENQLVKQQLKVCWLFPLTNLPEIVPGASKEINEVCLLDFEHFLGVWHLESISSVQYGTEQGGS